MSARPLSLKYSKEKDVYSRKNLTNILRANGVTLGGASLGFGWPQGQPKLAGWLDGGRQRRSHEPPKAVRSITRRLRLVNANFGICAFGLQQKEFLFSNKQRRLHSTGLCIPVVRSVCMVFIHSYRVAL